MQDTAFDQSGQSPQTPQVSQLDSKNTSDDAAFEAKVPEDAHESSALPVAEQSTAELAPVTTAPPVEAKKVRFRAKPKFSFPVPVRAVIFDLDGTLLDTAPDIVMAANQMRAAFGFAPLPPETIRGFIGKGIPNLVSRVLKDAVGEVGKTALKVAVANFEKHYGACFAETSQPYPRVIEGLEAFRAKGFAMGCVTNKAMQFTEPLLQRTGLSSYFSLVVAGDTLAEKKPHPLPILHAAKTLGIKIEELLVIGDSANDAQAARAAGAPVFIVPYGYNEGQELRGLDCDAFIDDLPHALKFVRIAS